MRIHTMTQRSGRTVLLLLALLVALFAGVAAILIHLQMGTNDGLRPDRSETTAGPISNSELTAVPPAMSAEPRDIQAGVRIPVVEEAEGVVELPTPGVFEGQVVCHRSGEPLPEYAISAYALDSESQRGSSGTTNEVGEFRFSGINTAGRVRCSLKIDMKYPTRSHSDSRMVYFDPDGSVNDYESLGSKGDGRPGPFLLAVKCGPTCFFDVDWPVGYTAEDFIAQITARRPKETGVWGPRDISGPLRDPTPSQLAHPDLFWARFPAVHWENSSWIELRSTDNRLRGGVRINQVYGTVEEPLRIALEPVTSITGILDLVTLDTDEEYQHDWCELRLKEILPAQALRGAEFTFQGGHAEHGEVFRFDHVDPGEYILSTHDAAWKPWSIQFTVTPGQNDIGRYSLEPRPVAGPVRGRIVSESGQYEGGCHVSLHDLEFEHDAHYDHSIDWEEDENGRFNANIEFENVRSGEWKLYVHCHDGFEWPLSLQTVQAPKEDVLVRLLDRRMDLVVDIVDAATGQPVEKSDLTWRVGEEQRRADGPQVEVRDLPYNPSGLEYWVEAEGYQPFRGTALDFTSSSLQGQLTTLLEGQVKMKKGWGTRVYAYDQDSRGVLPGVEILANGISQGTTDEEGFLSLALDAAPKSLRGVKDGWEWVGSLTISIEDGTVQILSDPFRLPMVKSP